MSEQAQESASPGPAAADQLRFTCPHCRLELSAPLAVAEVVAPCPGCGESIQAPPAPVSKPTPAPTPPPEALPASQAPAADAPPKETPEPSSEPVEESWADEQSTKELPAQRIVRSRRRRKRPAQVANPGSAMTEDERREVRTLIKFVLSVLATAAITWAVCKVVSKSIMNGPPPTDSRVFIRR